MNSFIFEDKLELVSNKKTKEYIEEVLSCYNNGNYRASIVVLYTTVIYDLLNKLIILRDEYNNLNAKSIIEVINKLQKEKPKNPEWEKKLIEKIFKEIKFISAVELAELENLSSQRNYAAHPIIYLDNIENELVLKPLSKETSRDLIRKAFEIVFLKDAILGIELKDMFLEDLKQHYKKVKTNGLELFLNNKYFSKMTQEKKDSLFRVLWKFVFLLDNDECNINRESNYWGIQFLYNTDKKYFNNYIKNHEEKLLASLFVSTFYEDSNIKIYNKYNEMIKNFEKNNNIISLINFIINNPKIYKYLNEHAKNIINTSVKQMYIKEDIINTPFYETKSKNQNLFKA